MRTATLTFALLLPLAACGEPASKYQQAETQPVGVEAVASPVPSADPTPSPKTDTPPAVEAPLWDVRADADGVTLVLTESGPVGPGPLLSLACLRDGGFAAIGHRFEPIGSEERMSVGAGDTVVALVAEPVEGEAGVSAKGQINGELIDALSVGRRIAASYGAQSVGPFEPPPEAVLSRFTTICREYVDPGRR